MVPILVENSKFFCVLVIVGIRGAPIIGSAIGYRLSAICDPICDRACDNRACGHMIFA